MRAVVPGSLAIRGMLPSAPRLRILCAAAVLAASWSMDALAEGDPDKGAKTFRKCRACHAIVASDGTTIVRGGKVGPNLFGVAGRPAAAVEGFKYGKGLIEASEKGLVWDEENFIDYIRDPPKFVAAYVGVPKVAARMAFKLGKGGEDLYAYLSQVATESE